MDKLLDEALKYYKELQDESPDNLALPRFHKAMQALIDRSERKMTLKKITLSKLQEILDEQKKVVAEYITKNLSCYTFWSERVTINNSMQTKAELFNKVIDSPYPNEFLTLKKYLKDD